MLLWLMMKNIKTYSHPLLSSLILWSFLVPIINQGLSGWEIRCLMLAVVMLRLVYQECENMPWSKET